NIRPSCLFTNKTGFPAPPSRWVSSFSIALFGPMTYINEKRNIEHIFAFERTDPVMIDYRTLPKHQVLCLDMKSFFASCECVRRGFDPEKTYLAVVGDLQRSGSVVLAATPLLKQTYGIRTGKR